MITSPIQHVPDVNRDRLNNAIADLQATSEASALTVCMCVVDGYGDLPFTKRTARIALAANMGCLTLLKRRVERG